MTATVPRPAPARHRASDSPGTPARRAVSTPGMLRRLFAVLILLALAWGAFGGWMASQHSSAADALVATNEPLSLDAGQMYEAIADADATITAAYLASPNPPLTQLQRYQGDVATVAKDLAELRGGGDQTVSTDLAAIGGGLPLYTDYVAKAESMYAAGFPLTGGSFLQVASEEAHLVLLPGASTVFSRENAELAAASGQATGLPTVIVALVLAVITGFALFRTQRWLTRRTNRMLSPALVLASLLLVVSAVWLAAGFFAARSDLDRGIGHGSAPAEDLAQASIGIQQIRGDAVLNAISRSGNASFSDDFHVTSAQIGPGKGTLLDAAAAAQPPTSDGASLVANIETVATAWYAGNSKVYSLATSADYSAEKTRVGASGVRYAELETDITAAINADQGYFTSAATSGAHTLDPLAWVVIAAAAVMALASGWGLSRRLAEYR